MRSKDSKKIDAIRAYVESYESERGVSPTVGEIATAVGMSRGNAHAYLKDMADRGILRREGGWRGTRSTRRVETLTIPVVGNVACGGPMYAEQNIEGYIPMSRDMLGSGEYFALVARGDSMIGAGIDDGDTVILRRTSVAYDGQIVAALVEDNATLKRYYREASAVRLHPENDTMSDMYFDTREVQGVAVKVIKDVL